MFFPFSLFMRITLMWNLVSLWFPLLVLLRLLVVRPQRWLLMPNCPLLVQKRPPTFSLILVF